MPIELFIAVLIFLIIRRFRIRLPKFRRVFLFLMFITGNVFLSVAGGIMIPMVATLIHLVLYGLLVAFLLSNFFIPGVAFAGIGSGMNFLSLLTHSGKMPVDVEALMKAGQEKVMWLISEGESFTHTIMDSGDPLGFLGDIIPLPAIYPFAKVISIGDILLFMGIMLFLRKLPRVGG